MLATIWFILWCLLWAVYFILDGFDLGLGALLPFVAKNEGERRVVYNAAGPFWDGNEVWLIAAGGVTFAAFPKTYAVMFSALYLPLIVLLFALILRAVSFEFRNKIDHPAWRGLWDTIHFIVNLAAAVLLGVAFANLFKGIPVDAQGVFHGSLFWAWASITWPEAFSSWPCSPCTELSGSASGARTRFRKRLCPPCSFSGLSCLSCS